ncbi:pyrimidine reductase family protein [Kribbella sp. NBC_01245]|uniref:pyrimidine reductase family protein n=1 Tax=Kribbella sp. NBC_01245 TaxID=2903578 RepID=UPI002E2C81AC|nr:pyrimidine reductase family protein [Kribbella sp. NBC_01245]
MIRRLDSTAELTEDDLVAAYAPSDRSIPAVRANMVSSLDGAVEVLGISKALGDTDDKQMLGRLRMLADAVLVGAGTVRAENYNPLRVGPERQAWRRTQGLPDHPVLAIVSSRLELDPSHRSLAEATVRPIVITHAAAPADRRTALTTVADVVIAGEREVDPAVALAELNARGFAQVLCEGGPALLGAIIAADLLDELCLSLSPLLIGGVSGRIVAGVAAGMHRMSPVHVLQGDGGMLFTRYRREKVAGL